MKSKKEVAGVDFAYGLVVCRAISDHERCYGCVFHCVDHLPNGCVNESHDTSDCYDEEAVFKLLKIPRKKAYVVGLDKVNEWVKKEGYAFNEKMGVYWSEIARNKYLNMELLEVISGKALDEESVINARIPADLIEYK